MDKIPVAVDGITEELFSFSELNASEVRKE